MKIVATSQIWASVYRNDILFYVFEHRLITLIRTFHAPAPSNDNNLCFQQQHQYPQYYSTRHFLLKVCTIFAMSNAYIRQDI